MREISSGLVCAQQQRLERYTYHSRYFGGLCGRHLSAHGLSVDACAGGAEMSSCAAWRFHDEKGLYGRGRCRNFFGAAGKCGRALQGMSIFL